MARISKRALMTVRGDPPECGRPEKVCVNSENCNLLVLLGADRLVLQFKREIIRQDRVISSSTR